MFIDFLIINWYFVELIISLITEKDSIISSEYRGSKSREKLFNDLLAYKSKVEPKLASALYDYLVYACLREMRYSNLQSNVRIEKIGDQEFREDMPMSYLKETAKFSDKNILNVAEKVYSGKWKPYFGGEAWLKATRIAKMYGKVPNSIFIDSTVDLQHNTGIILDKPWNYFCINKSHHFKNFISQKALNTLPRHFWTFGLGVFDREVIRLFLRYIHLYDSLVPEFFLNKYNILDLIRNTTENISSNISLGKLLQYKPIHYQGLITIPENDILYF